MKAKELIKKSGATISKVGRHGAYTAYTVQTEKGKEVLLSTATKKGATSFNLHSKERLITPTDVFHHESGYITTDNISIYVKEQIVVETLKLN